MKIGIDAHNLEGQRTGVGRVLINLVKEWSKFDLPSDLEFILYFKKEIPDDLEFRNRILRAPFGLQSNAFFMHWLLPRAARKDQIDILFCPGYLGPIFYQGKMALILHDIIYQARPDLYNWPSIWDKILLKKFSQISAQKAKIIFVPSEFSKQEVLKYYQVDPDQVMVTRWGVDQNFQPIDDKDKLEAIKKKYQIKDKFIFYIGSIFNRRHLPEAIRAFEKIVSQLPNYQFLIIGVNHTSPFIDIDGLIKEVNQKLGRPAILHQEYLGGRELAPLYNAADLLVYLSDYEGFGLPVLESMACGTPVVTSSTASIPEVAGQAAIYIQNNSDIKEIAEGIYRGVTDQELRQDLIVKGLEQAKKFSWQKCAQQILNDLLNS
jgi:glycosyltransferase involved in cell wall biosynthesis